MDETLDLIGDEALSRCLDLRITLKKHQDKFKSKPAMQTPPTSQSESRAITFIPNLPQSMSTSSITSWKSSQIPLALPPLPKVLDPTLEASSFVHVGCGRGKPTDLNYERLEWVGDAYLYLTSTLLISQTFPSLLPGRCSQIRERLVKNVTLAHYSRQYGFDKRLVLPPQSDKQPAKESEMTKILGDVFEAYVAAIVLSDQAEGVRKVSEWLKDLWSMTIATDILEEERNGLKLDSPLWRLRGTAEPVQKVMAEKHHVPLNAKEQLQRLIGTRGVKISYRDLAPQKNDPNTRLPVFSVGVYFDGWGEKDKMLGSGKGLGKKEAGMKAAEMALGNKKVMRIYTEKKRIFDEQQELEREALEKQGGLQNPNPR